MTFITNSAEETEEIGARLAKSLDTGGVRSAFIAMKGEMGVGKTAFVRGFCSQLGIKGVKSPTYTVVNEYRGTRCVFHFDMYRIEGEDDLYSIGYDDYVERDGYCIVEWSENIEELLPLGVITVKIERDGEHLDRRIITINSGIENENIGI